MLPVQDETSQQPGIQSVEIASTILGALADLGGRASLKDLSAQAGLSSGKVHRYLVSLVRTGLVKKTVGAIFYELGTMAMSLGLVALKNLNPVTLGIEELAKLRDQTNHTCALAVWGNGAPVVVAIESSRNPVAMNVKVGWSLPLATTAMGQVFMAHHVHVEDSDKDFELIKLVQGCGYAKVEGLYVAGVAAIAAPVFDHTGELAMAIGIVGHREGLSVSQNSSSVTHLLERSSSLSASLGFIE